MGIYVCYNGLWINLNKLCITLGITRISKGGRKMKINSCKTHIERALDEMVAQTESYPILTELSEEEKLSTVCAYCEQPAIYVVANQ